MTSEQRILTAATGYMELGMPAEAAAEIECLPPEMRAETNILKFRLGIYTAAQSWPLVEAIAHELAKREPEDPEWWVAWAIAARRVNGAAAAKSILLDAERKHPENASIHYNIGCYACQMGDNGEAKRRVSNAIHFDSRFRAMALDDPDLTPLWDQIAQLA